MKEDVILSNELIGQIRKIDGEGYAAIDYYGRIRDYVPTRQEAWNLVCHYEVARKYYKQQSYTQE